jgi:DNA-binding helix-turn-helix protein
VYASKENHRMTIINRIKVVLVEKQRTSKWLAEQLGKSENTISKWCSNKVQPSLESLYEIAKLLDIEVRTLIVPSKEQE